MNEYHWDSAAKIRVLRDYLGLSVAQMAKELDVSLRSYQSFESGRAAVPQGILDDVKILTERLAVLADAFASQEVLTLAGMNALQLRAAGMAAVKNPHLVIQYGDD